MRIKYAEFENFKHLYSALNKYKVVLDFENMPHIINVIIGEMGSGKTTILSHLQPGAGVGTLDERNTDGVIIEGMNGHSKLVFQDGNTEYTIDHHWKWDKDHHTLKSYFKKNDEELNPNGNQSSFKDLTEVEMGFDQNYLRLLRLGPNVSNIISMTSAERKEYLASRLPDVDLYLAIAKDMNDKSRTLAAQAQVLSRKLNNVTDDSIKDMRKSKKQLLHELLSLETQLKFLTAELNKLTGESNAYLRGETIETYSKLIESHQKHMNSLEKEIDEINERLSEVSPEYKSVADVTKEIGSLESVIQTETESINILQQGYDESESRKNELLKMESVNDNNEYIKSLTDTYAMQISLVESIANELGNFKCKFSSVEIKSIMAEVQIFNMQLSEIFEYDRESVQRCMNRSESSMKPEITKTIDKLRGRKFNLQKMLNNVDFIGKYEVLDDMELPKECHCYENCPYYTTHPSTVSSSITSVDDKHTEILQEIEAIDSRINNLSEYPLLAKKISNIRDRFVEIHEKLDKLGVIRVKSINSMLTNASCRVWYDNDALVNILEKVTKKEKMASIQVSLPGLKAEIDKYSNIDLSSVSVEIGNLEAKMESIRRGIFESDTKVSESKKRIEELTKICDIMMQTESMRAEISKLTDEYKHAVAKLEDMNNNLARAIENQDRINELQKDINEFEIIHARTQDEYNSLKAKIEELEKASKELNEVMELQNIVNIIKEAASSKKGIPLVYIKLFLDDCVEIINELISMVFDDTIEIKEFNVTEKDFFIPYYKNGIEIPDVKYASQGERAIISLALSFALMRKGLSKYNILLLDEIDGALYSKDREKFLLILAQQIKEINAEQVFLITHNNCFDGYPINVIMTTPEHVDKNTPVIYA